MTFVIVAAFFAICWIVGVEHSAPKDRGQKASCEASERP